jgi:hypothetical protein
MVRRMTLGDSGKPRGESKLKAATMAGPVGPIRLVEEVATGARRCLAGNATDATKHGRQVAGILS